MLSSLSDETPEGKSIVELGRESHLRMRDIDTAVTRMIKFTAETRCSGVDLADGTRIRKGAFDSIRAIAERAGNEFPLETEQRIRLRQAGCGSRRKSGRKALNLLSYRSGYKPFQSLTLIELACAVRPSVSASFTISSFASCKASFV